MHGDAGHLSAGGDSCKNNNGILFPLRPLNTKVSWFFCIRCNQGTKFKRLKRTAREFGSLFNCTQFLSEFLPAELVRRFRHTSRSCTRRCDEPRAYRLPCLLLAAGRGLFVERQWKP